MFHVKHNNDSLTETAKQLFGESHVAEVDCRYPIDTNQLWMRKYPLHNIFDENI